MRGIEDQDHDMSIIGNEISHMKWCVCQHIILSGAIFQMGWPEYKYLVSIKIFYDPLVAETCHFEEEAVHLKKKAGLKATYPLIFFVASQLLTGP